jgi:hypothetical protein
MPHWKVRGSKLPRSTKALLLARSVIEIVSTAGFPIREQLGSMKATMRGVRKQVADYWQDF